MIAKPRGLALLGVTAALLAPCLAALRADGATAEDAPPECRAQVAAALRALEPIGCEKSSLASAISAYVPARFHAVTEGTLATSQKSAHCPDDMADVLGRFCVDRYEGSLVERGEGGAETAHTPYEMPLDDHVYFARSVRGVIPQGYVSAAQADRACRASGKRLCHPVEWRAACGGSHAFAFPYGPARKDGVCHDHGAAPMLVFHADTLKRGWGLTELNDPRLNQLEGTVAKTGAFPDCVNDFGAFDMVGNLDEWTADPNGTFQGGYWLDTSQHGEGCAYRTISHGFGYHDYSTGFRCCRDVDAGQASGGETRETKDVRAIGQSHEQVREEAH